MTKAKGKILVKFTDKHKMIISNAFFQRRTGLYIKTKYEIDFIITIKANTVKGLTKI